MDTTTMRRTGALLASAALLASLTVATVAAPVSAQVPTCDGKPATIVGGGLIEGTDGDDVIVGSDGDDFIEAGDGNDTICAGKGNDAVDGGPMRDRIFGGSGDDVIFGGGGGDDIFGYGGNDRLLGQGGNDFINGGTGTDDCRQGAGSGAIKQCEKADLKVRVFGPGYQNPEPEDMTTYRINVVNLGPRASGYILWLKVFENGVECTGQDDWVGPNPKALLKPGRKRTHQVQMTCDDQVEDATSTVRAIVDADARDPKPKNNKAFRRTDWD